ncbi:hypothetical protein RMONA_07375 [Rickettsia monacensis]|uniref:Leucine Rich repeats (2 copies) n=1 Tax=Rickettsia monacensis TaxID=109232 RepID=A0A0B7J165_9RICK|nr:Ran GTPase-activating protein (RanGAP) involved in mRNA processing and transport [Rickettsia monacensis]CDI29877.1 Ran GTPase-activating protein (RanGAP) involved in mRNA processing and transport [Rickettsia monacensis IrR/Munich]CEO17826.1 hypothetical protein RMONA_07375 [Rickettsia monacensis]
MKELIEFLEKRGFTRQANSLRKGDTTLNLSYNDIGEARARDLAANLKANNSLTSLDLRWNKIGEQGAKELALMLKDNSTITELNLRYNSTGIFWGYINNATLDTINGYLQRNKTIVEKKQKA